VPTLLPSLLAELGSLPPGVEAAVGAGLLGAGAGLLSIPHCAAMCGPLAVFGCAPRGGARDPAAPLAWLAGRTGAYVVLGGLLGAGSGTVSGLAPRGLETWIALGLAAALAISAVGLLRRPAAPALSASLTPRRPSLASRLSALVLAHRPSPLALGALTGLLPCGALWAGLAAATATGSAGLGALSMLAFSLASAPGLGLAALTASRAPSSDPMLKRLLGGALLAGALVLTLRPLVATEADPACHGETPLVGSAP
jgi:hypothetical protein